VSHLVIADTSKYLRHALWLGLNADSVTNQLVTAEQNIVMSNPAQSVAGQNNVVRQLSWWLYHVLPNEYLRNATGVRRTDQNDDSAEFYPPLALDLLYLLTPSTGSDVGDQQVLGRAMQIFYDQSILRMESLQNPDRVEELHISLAPRTIQELAEVWEAMQQPYRLSVCYEVRVVRIDSTRRKPGGRVADRSTQFEPMVA
jgi:hypothetical protein